MKKQFKTHISAKHKLFDLHIRETFQYRDLITTLVKKNFTAQYKQTVLGPAWAIINPLLSTVVHNIIFGNLAKLTRADIAGDFTIPSFLFYMSGNICWGFFASVLSSTSSTFLDNRGTMGKVYYPRIAAPIASAFSNLISFGIQFALLIGFLLYYLIKGGTSIAVTPKLLLIPVLLLHMICLGIGFGIVVSSVTTKYRDLNMLVSFGLGLWRYACPIAYGLQLVPEEYIGLYMLNPASPIVAAFRYALFGFGYFDLRYYLLSWGFSLVVLLIGLMMFSKVERTFMDTI